MRLILALLASAALTQAATRDLNTYTFGHYLKEFGKVYPESDYETRKAQFEARVAEIVAHNALPGQTYTKGINHMTDWTDAEFKRVLGYKQDLARKHRKQNTVPEFKSTVDVSTLPNSVDWREVGAVSPVKDQGHCGSCWTFAAASTIESHYFLYTGKIQELSQQQIAGCTSNPLNCGGSGGCEGGIAQLAFEGVIKAGGIASEWTYPYISYFGTDFDCVYNATKMGSAAQISGYMNVLQNDYASLMDAVANKGPISISLDASSFHSYEKGVYNGCNQDQPDIDHAVQLVGYGTDKLPYFTVRNSWAEQWGEKGFIRIDRTSSIAGTCYSDPTPGDGNGCNQDQPDIDHAVQLVGYGTDTAFGDYWLVRNSWGPTWGEDGYIRIARQTDRQLCAVDITPSDGSGCDDGPANITVCGTCGILYDNTFPTIN